MGRTLSFICWERLINAAAYGQTGSGKTHTIFGDDESDYIEKRLVQQSLHSLFCSIKMSNTSKDDHNELCLTTAKGSFFEIINKRVYDLLSNDADDTDLPVRVDEEKGVYLEGLAEEAIANIDEVLEKGKRLMFCLS
jgi:kinesin family protein 5